MFLATIDMLKNDHLKKKIRMVENLENNALVVDLVSWVAKEPRSYDEVMAAWKTSCPRLSVWEDAVDAGFVERFLDEQFGVMVRATSLGQAFLDQ